MTELCILPLPGGDSDHRSLADDGVEQSKKDENGSSSSSNCLPHADSYFLVFFLTNQLEPEVRAQLISNIEEDDYKGCIIAVDWPHERPGGEADIKRLLYQACVKSDPFASSVVGFIDDQSAKDGKLLMVESEESDGELTNSRRMMSRYCARTAVACSLACIVLAEAVEED